MNKFRYLTPIIICVTVLLSLASLAMSLKSSSNVIVHGLPTYQNFQTNSGGYGVAMTNGIATSTLFGSSTPTVTGLVATGTIQMTSQTTGCAQFNASGVIASTGVNCSSGAGLFFSTTSVQNLATTTLSNISASNGIDIYAVASTSGAEFNYSSYRMCFNSCSNSDSYRTYGTKHVAANTVASINNATPGGVILTDNATLLDTAPAGGDMFVTRCYVDNNTTNMKSGSCVFVAYSNRAGTATYSSLVNFRLIQASAAPITSVSFSMVGTSDAPTNFAIFATSTLITAKSY